MIIYKARLIILKLLVISFALALGIGFLYKQKVAALDITVNTNIPACLLKLTLYPEKRIPATNNWSTNVQAELYTSSNIYITSLSGNTNNQGEVTFDLCANNIFLTEDNYRIWIKGTSHLRKDYGINSLFTNILTDLNLTPVGELLAGETSVDFDNYINVLDISTQVEAYGSNSNVNDLNQDGIVNILDISNTVTNLYTDGECSPNDQLNGDCRY